MGVSLPYKEDRMKFMKLFGMLFLAFLCVTFMSIGAMADGYDFANLSLDEMDAISEAESGDKLLVYDTSVGKGKVMDAANPVVAGDIKFRSTLFALGREGGASTVSSSSTAIDPMNQSYTVVRKCIGGNSGLDETGVGTILENGTPGKVLILVVVRIDTGGSWIVTPRTSLVMTKVVLDAVREQITLVYFNDTTGWVPMSIEGATVTYNTQA